MLREVMYHVVLKKQAHAQYAKLAAKDKRKILAALQGLRLDPWMGKKLQGPLSGLFSLRVWPWRIIYTIEKNIVTVTVVAIGNRKDVYRKLR